MEDHKIRIEHSDRVDESARVMNHIEDLISAYVTSNPRLTLKRGPLYGELRKGKVDYSFGVLGDNKCDLYTFKHVLHPEVIFEFGYKGIQLSPKLEMIWPPSEISVSERESLRFLEELLQEHSE